MLTDVVVGKNPSSYGMKMNLLFKTSVMTGVVEDAIVVLC